MAPRIASAAEVHQRKVCVSLTLRSYVSIQWLTDFPLDHWNQPGDRNKHRRD